MWLFIDIFILTVHCVLINSIKMLCFLILSSFLLYGTKCQDDSEGLYTSKVLRNNNSLLLEYEDSRYFFNTEFEANFFSAFQFCKKRNMELLSIESADENNRIGLFLVEKGLSALRFWTSAVNLVSPTAWIWLATGKEIKYFNWDNGEPTGNIPFVSNYENCIQARHEGNRGFTWNDLNCHFKNYIICEAPITCKCISPRSIF
ncbi:unnamed protein product [Psylliodes chrysocephalus]|uniref:C-type lectin domain-containing protein n=1 Tax=Psylliodes chrysocephalus TaxID=3402493 RepID=A0A9P0G252_9CUCU|nr:unnamed protein product [Psylliodes chrysocephala]